MAFHVPLKPWQKNYDHLSEPQGECQHKYIFITGLSLLRIFLGLPSITYISRCTNCGEKPPVDKIINPH